MGCFYGNGTWSWLCLIPFLVMVGFMVMMFVMARRCCMGWTGARGPGQRLREESTMENQAAHKWKGMRGSTMQSCMEMMSRRMPAATHDKGTQDVFDRWSKDLEQKIMDLLDKKGSAGPSEIASALGIPEDVAVSLLHRLAWRGRSASAQSRKRSKGHALGKGTFAPTVDDTVAVCAIGRWPVKVHR